MKLPWSLSTTLLKGILRAAVAEKSKAMLHWAVFCSIVYALPNTSSLYSTVQHLAKADVENSLKGVHLTIVTTEDPPFIIVRDGPNEPIKPWEEWGGWIPEIIKETAKVSGFTYTLQLSSNECTYCYGASDKEVIFGKTRTNQTTSTFPIAERGGFGIAPPDVHWAGAYITTKRLDAFDMTDPFLSAPLSLMVRRASPDWNTRFFAVFRPFTNHLYITIVVLWLFSSTLLFAMEYTADHEFNVFIQLELREAKRLAAKNSLTRKSSAKRLKENMLNGLREGKNMFSKEQKSTVGMSKTGGRKSSIVLNAKQLELQRQLESGNVVKQIAHFALLNFIFTLTFSAKTSWHAFFVCYVDQLYLGFLTLTGVKTYAPSTPEGKQLSLLWNLVVVIIRTSFVASSAVYLVQGTSINVPDSFTQHLHPDLKCCVLGGSAYAGYLRNHRRCELAPNNLFYMGINLVLSDLI